MESNVLVEKNQGRVTGKWKMGEGQRKMVLNLSMPLAQEYSKVWVPIIAQGHKVKGQGHFFRGHASCK